MRWSRAHGAALATFTVTAAIVGFAEIAGGCSSARPGLALPGLDAEASVPEDAGPMPVQDGEVGVPSDAAQGDGPSLAALAVVHAAPGVPTFRLCFSTAAPGRVRYVLPIPPLPDTPSSAPAVPPIGAFPSVPQGTRGIAPGTIRALPGLSPFGSVSVTPFLVLASSLGGGGSADGGDGGDSGEGEPDGGGPEPTCDALLGEHGVGTIDVPDAGLLRAGVDFWELATVSPGTFSGGATYLLSVTGCLPGSIPTGANGPGTDGGDAAVDGAGACGAGYDGGSSVELGIARLAPLPVDGGLGVQFAHRSSAIGVKVTPCFLRATPGDAGVSETLLAPVLDQDAQPIDFSSLLLAPPAPAAVLVDPAGPGVSFGVVLEGADGAAPRLSPYPQGDVVALPLAAIATLSDWGASIANEPAVFTVGRSYTFVLLGDPAQESPFRAGVDGAAPLPDPLYDGRGLHLVAFPNTFAPRPSGG